jgi:hypothetical protein
MTLDDWSIFRKYNYRVSALNTGLFPLIRVGTETLGTFSCPPFSLPLLPNLTSLTWNAPEKVFPCIRSFVTQTLTTLNIGANHRFDPSAQPILSCIATLCLSVSHFKLYSVTESGDASIALQSWSHLVSVTMMSIVSNAAILHLSNLPSLQELYIGLCSTPIDADTQNLLRRPAFCALHTLDISCETLAPLNAFFDTFSLAPKTLFFRVTEGGHSMQDLSTSISHIPKSCAHSALKHLRIVDDAFFANPLAVSISTTVFQPMYAFRNLRQFHFEVEHDVGLHDATLMQMGEAWPLLEDLAIIAEPSTLGPHYITPNGLVSLLQHCPRLSSIHIAMDWSAVDRLDLSPDIPYEGFAHKTLKCADFGSSTIRHATGVAAFISAIAPKLQTITAWESELHYEDGDYEKYSSRWKAVGHLVKIFLMVREQERRMMLRAIGGTANGGVGS